MSEEKVVLKVLPLYLNELDPLPTTSLSRNRLCITPRGWFGNVYTLEQVCVPNVLTIQSKMSAMSPTAERKHLTLT